MGEITESEYRRFFRLSLPMFAYCSVTTLRGSFTVIEISEHGIVLLDEENLYSVGDYFAGTLQLHEGREVKIEGAIHHRAGTNQAIVTMPKRGIPPEFMMDEQRFVIRHSLR